MMMLVMMLVAVMMVMREGDDDDASDDAGGGDDGNVKRARGQETDFVLRLGVSTAVFERRHVLGGAFFILMKTCSHFLQILTH